MSKSKTRREQFEKASLHDRIALARPHAHAMLWTAVDDAVREMTTDENSLLNHIESLLGRSLEGEWPADCGVMVAAIEASFALGMATGQLIRPEPFEIGGAR